EAVARAASTAVTAPTGPTYVGIPVDVLEGLLETARPLPVVPQQRAAGPAARDVERALELMSRSRRPLLWVGGGAVRDGETDALADLAWRLGAPVVTTYAGRGALPSGHPLLV